MAKGGEMLTQKHTAGWASMPGSRPRIWWVNSFLVFIAGLRPWLIANTRTFKSITKLLLSGSGYNDRPELNASSWYRLHNITYLENTIIFCILKTIGKAVSQVSHVTIPEETESVCSIAIKYAGLMLSEEVLNFSVRRHNVNWHSLFLFLGCWSSCCECRE
jgi:hypothetical protein